MFYDDGNSSFCSWAVNKLGHAQDISDGVTDLRRHSSGLGLKLSQCLTELLEVVLDPAGQLVVHEEKAA